MLLLLIAFDCFYTGNCTTRFLQHSVHSRTRTCVCIADQQLRTERMLLLTQFLISWIWAIELLFGLRWHGNNF